MVSAVRPVVVVVTVIMSTEQIYLLDDLPYSPTFWCAPAAGEDDEYDALYYRSPPFYPPPEPPLDIHQPPFCHPSPLEFPPPPPSRQLRTPPIGAPAECATGTPRTMQKSLSSEALDQTKKKKQQSGSPILSSSSETAPRRAGSEGATIRRACSTGDLKKTWNDDLLAGKGGEGGNPTPSEEGEGLSAGRCAVGRYSSEERRRSIERYRSKRNHRNFGKTIKYACRKTLAEGRPRVRGRFARSGEISEAPPKMDLQ